MKNNVGEYKIRNVKCFKRTYNFVDGNKATKINLLFALSGIFCENAFDESPLHILPTDWVDASKCIR